MENVLISIGKDFEHVRKSREGSCIFAHRPTGLEFQYVPAGSYEMGLSHREEIVARSIAPVFQANVDEMRPVLRVSVSDLLVATTPVLRMHLKEKATDKDQTRPVYFRKSDAEKFLMKWGLRLPSEREREYFCRAGTTTLFPFGDQLPAEDELERWLSFDFSSLEEIKCNDFGLYGLFQPEWCADTFRASLAEDAPYLDGSFSIRGGGAYFWPWQDDEWVWCMSAMRSPASALEDGKACLRPVWSPGLFAQEKG